MKCPFPFWVLNLDGQMHTLCRSLQEARAFVQFMDEQGDIFTVKDMTTGDRYVYNASLQELELRRARPKIAL